MIPALSMRDLVRHIMGVRPEGEPIPPAPKALRMWRATLEEQLLFPTPVEVRQVATVRLQELAVGEAEFLEEWSIARAKYQEGRKR